MSFCNECYIHGDTPDCLTSVQIATDGSGSGGFGFIDFKNSATGRVDRVQATIDSGGVAEVEDVTLPVNATIKISVYDADLNQMAIVVDATEYPCVQIQTKPINSDEPFALVIG